MPLGQIPQEKKQRRTLNLSTEHIKKLEKNSLSTSEAARKIFDDYFDKNGDIILTKHQTKNIKTIIKEAINEVK